MNHKIILAAILCIGTSAKAQEFKMPSKCVMTANQQLMDYSLGFDADGAALYFDQDGKTVILDKARVVSKTEDAGVETIRYKAKQAKWDGKPNSFETVEKTLVVARDSEGRLKNITKVFDLAPQIEVQKMYAGKDYMGEAMPLIKSLDNSFSYNGDECFLLQSVGIELKNEKAKPEKKVYFDKKFCDSVGYTMKQMGYQNVSMCSGLISQANMAFENRNKELSAEGKSLKEYNYFNQKPGELNYSNIFNVSMAIQTCAISEGMLLGGGMGMGVPNGFGYGGFGYAKGGKNEAAGEKPPAESAK